MPDTTRPGSSRSDPRSTCRASNGDALADAARDELGQTLVGLPRSGLHATRDDGVALLLRVEDAPISQLGHTVLLDQRDLHEPIALRHVAEEEAVGELFGDDDLFVRAVEVDDLAARRARDVLPLAAGTHVHLLDLGRIGGKAEPLWNELGIRDRLPHDLARRVELARHEDLAIGRQAQGRLVFGLSHHVLSPVLSLLSAHRSGPRADPSGRSWSAGTSPAMYRAHRMAPTEARRCAVARPDVRRPDRRR